MAAFALEEFTCDREHKTKNIHYLTLYGKSSLNIAGWLEHGEARALDFNLHFIDPAPESFLVSGCRWSDDSPHCFSISGEQLQAL